jgi:hypothetical protein
MLLVFAAGFACSYAYFYDVKPTEKPAGSSAVQNEYTKPATPFPAIFSTMPEERASPYDWIKESQIHVYNDKIVIELGDAEWATFTDTNSMDPVFDAGTNAIEVVPTSTKDIHIGDIVSYESEYASGTIIHRVVEIDNDSDGWYCRLKGDNIDQTDPGKVRFNQIKRVVVALIY